MSNEITRKRGAIYHAPRDAFSNYRYNCIVGKDFIHRTTDEECYLDWLCRNQPRTYPGILNNMDWRV
jgi:hypothetical protein